MNRRLMPWLFWHLAAAAALLGATLAALNMSDLPQVGPGGCRDHAWRNPVTGRLEPRGSIPGLCRSALNHGKE